MDLHHEVSAVAVGAGKRSSAHYVKTVAAATQRSFDVDEVALMSFKYEILILFHPQREKVCPRVPFAHKFAPKSTYFHNGVCLRVKGSAVPLFG